MDEIRIDPRVTVEVTATLESSGAASGNLVVALSSPGGESEVHQGRLASNGDDLEFTFRNVRDGAMLSVKAALVGPANTSFSLGLRVRQGETVLATNSFPGVFRNAPEFVEHRIMLSGGTAASRTPPATAGTQSAPTRARQAVRGVETVEPAVSAAPPPTGGPPPVLVQRYLVARADDQVKIGVPFTLTARIAAQPSVRGGGASGPIGAAVTGKLKISIYAPGFTAPDGTQREIDVPPTGDSDWAGVELVATKAGLHAIDVMAWKDSVQVAGVTISVGVEVPGAGETSVQVGLEMREAEEGEYTLEVIFDGPEQRYRFQLLSNTGTYWPTMFGEPLVGQSADIYKQTIDQLNQQARNGSQLTAYAQGQWLKGMGSTLYRTLIPDDLKQAIWENLDQIRFLNILTGNERMPWELLYVRDPAETEEGKFIADSAIVSRRAYGPPPVGRISREAPYFVLPNGAPPLAQEEISYARSKLGAGKTIEQLDDLLKLFDAAQFSLLHFASHNVADPTVTGGLYIPFGGSRFDATFMGNWRKNQFRARSPLVFMNSCTSGGAVPLYTEMAGWADGFLRAGCGAFIGSLWEIRTDSAQMFANRFYDEITGGKNLGESMRAARSALSATDPTSLAYTLYGNPLASLA
jgi:hypothetical protein